MVRVDRGGIFNMHIYTLSLFTLFHLLPPSGLEIVTTRSGGKDRHTDKRLDGHTRTTAEDCVNF